MVDRNLIRGLDLNEQDWEQELNEALEGNSPDEIDWGGDDIAINQIAEGKIIRVIVLEDMESTSPSLKTNPLKGSVLFEDDLISPIDEPWETDE